MLSLYARIYIFGYHFEGLLFITPRKMPREKIRAMVQLPFDIFYREVEILQIKSPSQQPLGFDLPFFYTFKGFVVHFNYEFAPIQKFVELFDPK